MKGMSGIETNLSNPEVLDSTTFQPFSHNLNE